MRRLKNRADCGGCGSIFSSFIFRFFIPRGRRRKSSLDHHHQPHPPPPPLGSGATKAGRSKASSSNPVFTECASDDSDSLIVTSDVDEDYDEDENSSNNSGSNQSGSGPKSGRHLVQSQRLHAALLQQKTKSSSASAVAVGGPAAGFQRSLSAVVQNGADPAAIMNSAPVQPQFTISFPGMGGSGPVGNITITPSSSSSSSSAAAPAVTGGSPDGLLNGGGCSELPGNRNGNCDDDDGSSSSVGLSSNAGLFSVARYEDEEDKNALTPVVPPEKPVDFQIAELNSQPGSALQSGCGAGVGLSASVDDIDEDYDA